MSAFNLVRNTRVFFTTNVDATSGVIPTSGSTFTNTNTFELQVLDGFSFKQGTQTTQVQVKEAGNTPTRGQRNFNTSLDPVDFSFSTYMRPYCSTSGSSGLVKAEEQVLWNALMSADAIDTSGAMIISTVTAFSRPLTAGVTSDTVTITNTTPFSFTATGLSIGDVVTPSGLGVTLAGTLAQEWNTPVRIIAIAGTAAACTGLTIQYLTAPNVAAGLSLGTVPSSITFRKGAWVANIANATAPALPAYSIATFGTSNKNQMQKFGLLFVVDGAIYAVDNCAMDQAVVDFGLDAIAMIAWTGKGAVLRQLPATAVITGAPAVFSGAGNATGVALQTNVAAPYITNKLSTMQLIAGIQGSGTAYTVALTGGSMTIANGITFITPANLGIVNTAIGYFTGTRSITGTVNAYLKTGTSAVPNGTAKLLSDILSNISGAAETKYRLQVEIGGLPNAVRVEFDMDGCMLQVPTIETADVMATTIGFTAQGSDSVLSNNAYDLANTNDLTLRYFSPLVA